MKRKYLAVFLLASPQPEHARIVTAIREASAGDFKQAFISGEAKRASVIAYLFTSEIPPWKLSLGQTLLNEDDFLIVEIGDQFVYGRLGVAATWLRNHQDQAERS